MKVPGGQLRDATGLEIADSELDHRRNTVIGEDGVEAAHHVHRERSARAHPQPSWRALSFEA
jgi:hypothetical protein